MTRPPRGLPLPAPARWLLFGALVLGVLAMHHAPAPHGGGTGAMPAVSATHSPRDAPAVVPVAVAPLPVASTSGNPVAAPPASDGGHAMLHLCLAVLLAAAGLLLALAWLRRRRESAVPGSVERGPSGFARAPPPRTGRELLTTSCVLRI
ncbi:hypothetical protein QRX50_48765 [Amycolatopsis carbonis]|uniref:Uncharacterized protein n=1 Tax=Amycolatopsis carbonis TaxID=715471 RepID=A0A9Y2IHK0_9PSEU|nr:hypothetical protein [Amycolatopsis sp. 2-15]WIX79131.1 hypothetical protein QRX50_48765 [Amycolatopsis sp. 2-15]